MACCFALAHVAAIWLRCKLDVGLQLPQERAARRQLLTEEDLYAAIEGVRAAADDACLGLAPAGDALRKVLAEGDAAPEEVGVYRLLFAVYCVITCFTYLPGLGAGGRRTRESAR